MLSAVALMEKLAVSRIDKAEAQKQIAAARKAGGSIRDGVPLAEQTERTDEFFRRAAEALRLLGAGGRAIAAVPCEVADGRPGEAPWTGRRFSRRSGDPPQK